MSTSNSSDATNVVYEEYTDGPGGPRRSRRLQGIAPPAPSGPFPPNATNAHVQSQQPGLITPHVNLPVPRHHHQPAPQQIAMQPIVQQYQQQQFPQGHFQQPQLEPQLEEGAPPYQGPPPPPPPVNEVTMQAQQPSHPPRRLEFRQRPAGDDTRSHHSDITYQGALGMVQPGFIDTTSLPHGTETSSWPMHHTNKSLRHNINNEMMHMQNEMYKLQQQVDTIHKDVGSINESTRRTDECLKALNETNRSIQQAFLSHKDDFREFVRSDLGTIIQGHLKAAAASSTPANSPDTPSTNTSVFVTAAEIIPAPSLHQVPAPPKVSTAPVPPLITVPPVHPHQPTNRASTVAHQPPPRPPKALAPVLPPTAVVPPPPALAAHTRISTAQVPVLATALPVAPLPAPAPVPTPAPAPTPAAPPPVPRAPPITAAAPPVAAIAPTVTAVAPQPAATPPVVAVAPPVVAVAPQPDLAMMFQTLISGMDKKEKLTLPNLKKGTKGAHRTWKEEVMVALELHPSFQQYVDMDLNKYKSINSSLPRPLRTKLYMSLTKCLDQVIKTDIGLDGSSTDGVEILKRLEHRYGFLQKSELNRLSLVSDLESVIKDPNERITAYTLRFKNALEECRVNGVLALPPSSILLLYMRNLRTPCLFDVILGMSQGTPSEWTAITTIDNLRDKVEHYVEEYNSLHAALPSSQPKPSPKPHTPSDTSTQGTSGGLDEEWNKRMRRLSGGLRGKTEEQQVAHLCNLVSQRKSGCYLHDNDHHHFLNCTKLRRICEKEQFNCVAAISKAKAKVKAKKASTSQPSPTQDTSPVPAPTPSNNDTPSYARRVTEALEAQQAKFDKAAKKQARREERMAKQMEETTRFMQAMHMTMNNPAAANGVRPIWTSQEVNPFAHLDPDTDTEDEDEADDDDADDDIIDEDVDDDAADSTETDDIQEEDNNSNNDVSNYSTICRSTPTHSSVHTCHPEHIIGSCKKSSLTASTTIMVVDSGATAHMDNDSSCFEYILPVTTSAGKPVYVQQGDGTNLPVTGMGPVTKVIQGTHKIRYMSYLIPSLSCPLYSVKQHMDSAGCYFHAEGGQAILAFPDAILQLHTEPEIQFTATPPCHSPHPITSFNYETSPAATNHGSFQARVVKAPYFDPTFTPELQSRMATTVPFVLKSVLAKLPERKSDGAIGYDTTSIISTVIGPGQTAKVPTGLSCEIPKGMYLRLASRSSHAANGISVQGGVIDNDFRGEIQVILHNSSDKEFLISTGDRIAQMLFECAETPLLVVETKLSPTLRQDSGFGSTNHPQRKRRLIRTSSGLIYLDESTRRSKGRRVARPITTGLHHPPLPDHYNDTNDLWTSSSLQMPSEDDAHPQLYQKPHKDNPAQVHLAPTVATPRPQPQTRVNNADPKSKTMTQDHLLQSIGYLKPKSFLRNLEKLGLGTMKVSHLDRNPALSPGETASMKSTRSSKVPTTVRDKYSDLWHMDIGYGPCASIGGVKYTLLFVDNASRYKYVYPLKNLKSSLLSAVKRFFKDVKIKPKLIRTDFDNKLIHGDVRAYIEDTNQVDLESSPPYRQHENGLVERAWQTLVTMSRNWLTASLLPTKYWWFAIKRSVEVSNIMPTKHIPNRISTPHEIVFQKKVDYRTLFPMFSVAYLKQEREVGGKHKNKWRSRSIKCIAVGSDSKSDGLQFYHPPSKQILTGNNGYRLDTFLPAGPQFTLPYDGNFIFNTRSDLDKVHRPQAHEEEKTVFIRTPTNEYIASKVVSAPVDDESEPYTIQEIASGNIHELMSSDIHESDPSQTPTDPIPAPESQTFPLLPWVKPNAKVTLFLDKVMPKPKQGILHHDSSTDIWTFSPGKADKHPHIQLPNFSILVQSMVTNKKLFQGWKTTKTVLSARCLRAMSNIFARHVSAANLTSLNAPTLLRHHKLNETDKNLWDAAYREELNGLEKFPTWEVITEEDYRRIKNVVGKPLPTMAISTIKRDEKGNPKRCKYRIVVLGNLDNHAWSKTDCFAPVLSMPELRLLTSIAVGKKRIPKAGDVSQAFCQGVLPPDENYVLRPPPGCPVTPKNSYWRLIRTLYGLKRSPRHWYEKAVKILQSIGLKKIHNSNCIFKGTVIDGHPPLYVGLYVDDFIYFSSSDEVEKKFEESFGSEVKTTFEGDVTHFLGINFTTIKHSTGDVSIHLSQEAFIDTLLVKAGLDGPECATAPTPYRSGYPVDKIPPKQVDPHTHAKIIHAMQSYTGSFQWLASATRPDIATITNLLAQYNHCATTGHLDACKRVIRYLKGTKSKGIAFHSKTNSKLQAFVKFPIQNGQLTPFTDANWGPQDQSKPKFNDPPVEIFKSRSLSGFILWMNGPIHWVSKRQTITARSTAEAEIYATDECTKFLLHLRHILQELGLDNSLMPKPTTIYNDNAACVAWSHALTTKGLRHVQIRENAIREAIQLGIIRVKHIAGDINLSDLFTKEDKDVKHFQTIVGYIIEEQPTRT